MNEKRIPLPKENPMPQYVIRDLENLKRPGPSIKEIHYSVANTILNSEHVAANVRSLDRKTGQFEIVLTGTIDRSALENEPGR